MGILGIVFNQNRAVIGAKNLGGSGFLAKIAREAQNTLIGAWEASTLNGIVIDASVSEEHVSSCEVTENPVEDGANVTDHVQLNPARLTMEGVISDAPLGYAVIGNIQNLARSVGQLFGQSSRSINAYNELLKLQRERQPFTVITGLKKYDNMILTELSVPRTAATGASIHFRATMEEVRIVKSQVLADSNLDEGVKRVGQKVRDHGQKVTDPIQFPGPEVPNQEQVITERNLLDIFARGLPDA